MSYSITVRVYQRNPNAFFKIVEKGVWHYANGGTWSDKDGVQTLTMGGSGTSGMLRFMTEGGKEAFFVAMGVHNYKRWVDVITGLADDITCVKAMHEYYDNSNPPRAQAREAQRTEISILNLQSRTIAAKYSVAEGNNLVLDIVIG
ncbi:fruit body lectin [Ephemerocybe angulata]|uniref:Fruit body lectin n=1 Tax=Ephemerocybe angulata TaxID=980116 RepID=A0A8H6HAU5_9AGAR|nr:fruit body lectin [Tulosesus angulatus]